MSSVRRAKIGTPRVKKRLLDDPKFGLSLHTTCPGCLLAKQFIHEDCPLGYDSSGQPERTSLTLLPVVATALASGVASFRDTTHHTHLSLQR